MNTTNLKFLFLVVLATFVVLLSSEPANSADCKHKPQTCLRNYVKQGAYLKASSLYNENEELFKSEKWSRRRAGDLQKLADYLNQTFSTQIAEVRPKIESIEFDPADPENWEEISSALDQSRRVYESIGTHKILSDLKYQSETARQFSAAFESVRDEIDGHRETAFLTYDHGSRRRSFFGLYPLLTNNHATRVSMVIKAWPRLRPKIMQLGTDELLRVISSWTNGKPSWFISNFGARVADVFAETYYSQVMDQVLAKRPLSFDYVTSSFSKGRANALAVPLSLQNRLALFILDSPDDPTVAFSLEGLEAFKVIRDAPSPETLNPYDLIFVISVSRKSLAEETIRTGQVESRYEAGNQSTANPAYARAQSEYELAVNQVNIASSNYQQAAAAYNANQNVATGWMYGDASAALGEARKALASAEQRLRNTKSFLSRKVYESYSFSTSTIRLSKVIEGTVAMILPSAAGYRIADFHTQTESTLAVASGIHPNDAGSTDLFKTKSDLKAEEDKAISLNATHVLKNLDEDGARDKINDVDSFLAELGKPIKATVPVVRAGITPSQLSVSRSSHPSMDGVVVVRPPLAGIGTGFFVEPNLILTNYHVVEGLNHVPIELSNGSVGTGRVVDLDINRDLALIKTDVSGAPLELYAGHTLPLGESVVAIGHPSGLTFTVTKGIISAVREQRSRMSRGFGSEYLFVQTDTAISPGNSGGPLLLAGKVIGINTEKLVDVDVEGVGFALHYAEISRFLAAARSN